MLVSDKPVINCKHKQFKYLIDGNTFMLTRYKQDKKQDIHKKLYKLDFTFHNSFLIDLKFITHGIRRYFK